MNEYKTDLIYIFVVSLLVGMLFGVFFNTKYSVGIRTFFHNVYIKFHPNIEKDSKMIIFDNVTQNTPNINQTNIFEEPAKKNKFVLIIKKIFIHKKETAPTIHNAILN